MRRGHTGGHELGPACSSASSGVIHALNALAPRKGSPVVFAWSFFASWLTIELVWHHVVIGAVLGGLARQRRRARPARRRRRPGPVPRRRGAPRQDRPGHPPDRRHRARLAGGARARPGRAEVPAEPRRAPVPHGAPQGHPRRQEHRVRPGRRQGAAPRRHDAVGARPRRRVQAAGARPDPRRRLGDRRQARAGDPAAHPHGRPGVGRASTSTTASARRRRSRTTSSTASGPSRGSGTHADEYGIDPDFICVTGGSAGGHLTALMGTTVGDPRFQPGFEDADTSVAAAVPVLRDLRLHPDGSLRGRPGDLPPVPRADGDEGVRGRGAGALRGGIAAAPRARGRAALLRDPRRPRHAGAGGGRPRVRRADARGVEGAVLYAEMQGAQHAFEMFPSVRTATGDRGGGALPDHAVGAAAKRRPRPSRAELEDTLTD